MSDTEFADHTPQGKTHAQEYSSPTLNRFHVFSGFLFFFPSFLIVRKKIDWGREGRVEDLGGVGEQGKYDKVYCV